MFPESMTPPETIVALFARGREIGWAVFERSELTWFGIRTIRGRQRGEAFENADRRAVSEIVNTTDEPDVILEKADARVRLGGLAHILPSVIALLVPARRIRNVVLSDAKRFLCGSASATRADLIATVAERHPVCRLMKTPSASPSSRAQPLRYSPPPSPRSPDKERGFRKTAVRLSRRTADLV